MPKSKLPPRPWTTGEVRNLKSLCASGIGAKAIAKALGRTYAAVHRKRYLLGLTTHRVSAQLKGRVRALVRQGNPDGVICLKLKIKRTTLAYVRGLCELRANRSQWHTKRNPNRPWPVCFGCDARSPIMVENGWTVLTGWSSEVQHAAGATITVTLCPECQERK